MLITYTEQHRHKGTLITVTIETPALLQAPLIVPLIRWFFDVNVPCDVLITPLVASAANFLKTPGTQSHTPSSYFCDQSRTKAFSVSFLFSLIHSGKKIVLRRKLYKHRGSLPPVCLFHLSCFLSKLR